MANVINGLAERRDFNVYASAVNTVTPDTQEFDNLNQNMSGLIVVINVTAASGTGPTLTPHILGVDRLSGQTWELGGNAAITGISASGIYVIKIHPNLPNTTAFTNTQMTRQDIMPNVIRFNPVIGGTGPSFTFSMTGCFTD